jgi:hypothetical protein
MRAVVINGEQLSIEIEKSNKLTTNFDVFYFPRGDLPKTSHLNKICHPFTSIGKEDRLQSHQDPS